MQLLHPSLEAVANILHTCRRRETNVVQLLRLYAYMCESGVEAITLLANLLVMLLVEGGSMGHAQQVFDKLLHRDDNSWNALVVGYCQFNKPRSAIILYQKMPDNELACLSSYSFMALTKACIMLRDLETAYNLHADMARKTLLECDSFLSSTLVDMYGKCGCLSKSKELFNKISSRDVVSWTALIGGYAEHGLCEEAFKCVKQMQQEGISPNSFTFVCLLKACGCAGVMERGQEVHIEIVRRGMDEELFVGNALVDMYARCGLPGTAHQVFDRLPIQDIISWTALIMGYMNAGMSKDALKYFTEMEQKNIPMNDITFVCAIQACGIMKDANKGQEMHGVIIRKGLEKDVHIGNTLVDMYAKCGLLLAARRVFDKLAVQDAVSWSILMAAYTECGNDEEALNCFEWMQQKGIGLNAAIMICGLKACGNLEDTTKGYEMHVDIVIRGLDHDHMTCNALIDMYGKMGSLEEAQKVFDELPLQSTASWNSLLAGFADDNCDNDAIQLLGYMQGEGLCPDAITFVCGLKACCRITNSVKGQEIHAEIAKRGMEGELLVGNSLISMYSRCGLLPSAQIVFEKLLVQDVVSCTALMAGYAQHGESESVSSILQKMSAEGIQPNLVTMTCILNACSDAGLVNKGQESLDSLSFDPAFVPSLEAYTCTIDLLGRTGHLEEALWLIREMPTDPDIVVWLSLLGACRKWGTVKVGRHAFDNVLCLDRKNEAAYLGMYNIYVEACMLEEAVEIEVMRIQNHV